MTDQGPLLHRFLDFPGTDAGSADVPAYRSLVFNNTDAFHVGVPDFLGFFIGMAHAVAELNRFAAYITFRHGNPSLFIW